MRSSAVMNLCLVRSSVAAAGGGGYQHSAASWAAAASPTGSSLHSMRLHSRPFWEGKICSRQHKGLAGMPWVKHAAWPVMVMTQPTKTSHNISTAFSGLLHHLQGATCAASSCSPLPPCWTCRTAALWGFRLGLQPCMRLHQETDPMTAAASAVMGWPMSASRFQGLD